MSSRGHRWVFRPTRATEAIPNEVGEPSTHRPTAESEIRIAPRDVGDEPKIAPQVASGVSPEIHAHSGPPSDGVLTVYRAHAVPAEGSDE